MKPTLVTSRSREARPWFQRLLDHALWAVFIISIGRLAFPLLAQADGFVAGWQRQRQLKLQWEDAAQQQALRQRFARSQLVHPEVVRQPQVQPKAAQPTQHVKLTPAGGSHKAKAKTKAPVWLAAAPKQVDPYRLPALTPEPWPLVRLISERMNLDATVVEGVSEQALRDGPGHDPHSSPVGEGNCVIAAHRNMAGWWFYRLNTLRHGDRLTVETPEQIYTYRVVKVREVPGHDLSVLRAKPGMKPTLTLYSCTLPKTTKRLVVTATLESDRADEFSTVM